jgi:putative lipoprotein
MWTPDRRPSPLRAGFTALCIYSALGLASPAPTAAQADPDPWWAYDKALHLGSSFGLALGGYGLAVPFTDEPWERAALGLAFSLAFGVGKELADLAGYGHPSWKDLAWDGVGALGGVSLALSFDLWCCP